MSFSRGISDKEERARTEREIEHIIKPNKDWGTTKFKGRHVCAVCGEYITPKKGEKAVRHEQRTVLLGKDRKDTFWTYRHGMGCPKKKGARK